MPDVQPPEGPQPKISDEHTCYYCGPTDRELRPYGPGGSTICFPCMKATPERERAAHGALGALLDMTSSVGLTAIGTEAGPINVDAEDISSTGEESSDRG